MNLSCEGEFDMRGRGLMSGGEVVEVNEMKW